MRASRTSPQSSASRWTYLRFLVGLVLVVGILYAAEKVLVPLALAVLLTFILTPLVVRVQQWGLPRVPAVMLVVALTFLVFGSVGWGVGEQLHKLAIELPTHGDQMKAKFARIEISGDGPFSRLVKTFREIVSTQVGNAEVVGTPTPPPPTFIARPEPPTAIERLSAFAALILEPIATAGLVLILVIFMLVRREDLRNRIIGLLGQTRLAGTTRVFVESTRRLGRYLLMQLCVNAAFGILFGSALLIIGLPYWFLWGFLMVVLRFIPYVGSWMAAILPFILSVAISPGWSQPAVVLGIFLVLEISTANIAEPLLLGHSTGISPVALLVAAVFWTWIWGPIGLVLSTPLTVCLVVLGQYVPRLKFLSLLLGDQPALAPHVSYYQRLLAGDVREAGEVARQHVLARGMDAVHDEVFMPALLLARRDRHRAGLGAEDERFILDSTRDILQDLVTERSSPLPDHAAPSVADAPAIVLGCPAHHRSEELALAMLGSVMKPMGIQIEAVSTKTLPAEIEARIERERPALLFIAIVPPRGVVQASYLCRRMRERFPELKIVVGYLGRVRDFDKLLVRLRSAGASYVTTSLLQSRSQIRALVAPSATSPGSAISLAGAPGATDVTIPRQGTGLATVPATPAAPST